MNAKLKTLIIGAVLSLFLLAACAPKAQQPLPATAVPDAVNLDTMPAIVDPAQAEIQNKAADIVRAKLAAQINVEASSLQLVAVEPIDWADACLGAAQEGETCAQVITPGFRITFSSGDQTFTFHTDLSAGLIRQETVATQVS